jgi:hypothetical protein
MQTEIKSGFIKHRTKGLENLHIQIEEVWWQVGKGRHIGGFVNKKLEQQHRKHQISEVDNFEEFIRSVVVEELGLNFGETYS